MRLFIRNLVFLTFLLFCFCFLVSPVSAATTSFRSAGTVTTDGSTPYTNLGNCQQTDGLTCDRLFTNLYANLYFTHFGSFQDFGMPDGSVITKLYMRVTGKATRGIFGGSINGGNCDFQTTIFTFNGLIGSTLRTQTISNPVNNTGINPSIQSFCYQQSMFESGKTVIRLNYSSDSTVNWSANIDNLEIAFDYTPPPTPPAKTPLILIPGIGGSELKVNSDTFWSEPDGHGGDFTHQYPAGEKIWVNTSEALKLGNDDYFDVLRMNRDGTSKADVGITGNLFSIYQDEINFFVADGYELNKTLFIFPYDWRKDIADTAPLLDQKIAAIKQQTGSQQVDIVAHSMGGLVARNYIANVQRAHNIRKLIDMGGPHLGSVDLLRSILYGNCITIRDTGPICIGVSPSETKDVLQSMIGAFELFPSVKYFDFYSDNDILHPYPFKNSSGSMTYDQIKNYLAATGYDTPLFMPSEALHSIDATLSITNNVDVTNIAGSGEPTLGQIIDKDFINFVGIKLSKNDSIMINGDGTVPLFSASLIDPQRNISFLGNAKVYYTKQFHTGLVTSGPALNMVKNLLNGVTQMPAGVASQPFQFSGHQLSVHSPVNIHVYDAAGNHTGPTGDADFEEDIPGSTYYTIGDAKFIYLPDEGIYTVNFDSTGDGSFDFKIRTYQDDQNTETKLYKDLPLTPTTHGDTILNTLSDTPSLIDLDHDNDGNIDQQIAITSDITGEQNTDFTPPSTAVTLTGDKGNNGWFRGEVSVSIEAHDDNSGVMRTEYSLDGQKPAVNTSQLVISTEGSHTLKVWSIDNAGNEETIQEFQIKIDTKPPEAKIFIDPLTSEIVVDGIDSNPVTVEKEKAVNDNDSYVVTDEAGNILRILLQKSNKNNIYSFSIISLKYKALDPLLLEKNNYSMIFDGKRDPKNIKIEDIELQNHPMVRLIYDSKNNTSRIFLFKSGVDESLAGLRILTIDTQMGYLDYSL